MFCCGVHGAVYWIFLQLSLLLVLTILALFFKCTIGFHSVLQMESPLLWRMLSPVCNQYGLCCHQCAIILLTPLKALGWLQKHWEMHWTRSQSSGVSFAPACRFSLSVTHRCVAIHLYLRLVETSQTTVHYEVSYAMYKTSVMSEHCKMRLCRKLVHWSSLPTQPAADTDCKLSC